MAVAGFSGGARYSQGEEESVFLFHFNCMVWKVMNDVSQRRKGVGKRGKERMSRKLMNLE